MRPSVKGALLAASVAIACAVAGVLAGLATVGCGSTGSTTGTTGDRVVILASDTYLADIAQNVAGSKLKVISLLPAGVDPHSFEPTPRDARIVANSRVVIVNTPGFEPQVDLLVEGAAGPGLLVVEAAAGLAGRTPGPGETVDGTDDESLEGGSAERDPHFWLDPILVITYARNIEKALSAVDPADADTFRQNAEEYAGRLRELDSWIASRVAVIPVERRLLVTNHESLGYFADRYGFRIVGTVFPTLGVEGTPSAKQLAALVQRMRSTGAPAIFLETGGNSDLARQVARETGAKVVTDLYTHSLSVQADSYLEMMRWNVNVIVEALR